MQRLISRLLCLTPLILVISGSVLILLGTTASLKSCKIAGSVVVAVGGFFFLFLAAWSSRPDKFVENTNCEEAGMASELYPNRTALSADSGDQLGPIHHFEVKTSSESPSWEEMAPPSYEETVDNNDGIGNSQTSTEAEPRDEKEASLDNATSEPPSYEESHEKAKAAS